MFNARKKRIHLSAANGSNLAGEMLQDKSGKAHDDGDFRRDENQSAQQSCLGAFKITKAIFMVGKRVMVRVAAVTQASGFRTTWALASHVD